MANIQPSVDNAEHVGPGTTGDNIEAKRAANYGFNTSSQWGRIPLPLIDVAFDYLVRSNPDANGYYQTYTFKSGGSSGTTVRTLSFTYDASGNFLTIARS